MSDNPHGQTNQPLPAKDNQHPAIYDLVIEDLKARDAYGQAKYGTRLKPHNGRDSLRDAYEEAIDLLVYLRTLIEEHKTVEQAVANERQACINQVKRMAFLYKPDSPTGRVLAAVILQLETGSTPV